MENKIFRISFLIYLMIFSKWGGAADFPFQNMTGVYWGAFDPPTQAHQAIIFKSFTSGYISKIFVVVNNHNYKNYTYSLQVRMQLLKDMIGNDPRIEFLWQDEQNKVDYFSLKQTLKDPLCVIAGSDSYVNWVKYSTIEEREAYDAIAIVPRGDDSLNLIDKNAFLMIIDPVYKYVSSTKVKQGHI